jgi:hypothetical protein
MHMQGSGAPPRPSRNMPPRHTALCCMRAHHPYNVIPDVYTGPLTTANAGAPQHHGASTRPCPYKQPTDGGVLGASHGCGRDARAPSPHNAQLASRAARFKMQQCWQFQGQRVYKLVLMISIPGRSLAGSGIAHHKTAVPSMRTQQCVHYHRVLATTPAPTSCVMGTEVEAGCGAILNLSLSLVGLHDMEFVVCILDTSRAQGARPVRWTKQKLLLVAPKSGHYCLG